MISPEEELMIYLSKQIESTDLQLLPYVQRSSSTGEVIVGNKPYAIMGDIRVNHRMAMGVDYVSGGFVINAFFNSDSRRKAERWGEYMRQRLLGEYIETTDYTFKLNTVRKQVRPDITTQNILFRVTLTVTFERNN